MYRDPNAKPYMQQQPQFLNRLQGNATVDQRINRLQGLQSQGNLSQGRQNRLNKMLGYQEAQQSPFASFYQPRPLRPMNNMMPLQGGFEMQNASGNMQGGLQQMPMQQPQFLNANYQQGFQNQPQGFRTGIAQGAMRNLFGGNNGY